MHWLTLTFLLFLISGVLFRLWLSSRQIRYVRSHREAVPEPFRNSISLEDHQKAADYTVARTRLGMAINVWDATLLVLWTLGGGLALLDGYLRALDYGVLLTGIGFILSFFLISALLSLPWSIYQTFGIEARFGFNRTTPQLFAIDLAKGMLLSFIIGTPLIALILWLMKSAGEFWWIYAWIAWVAFGLTMTWAYPRFISPLFNKFSPLDDEALKERIETLLERCGFRSEGIFVMDGSKRSAHGNAYFTGMGNNKRIVFFDTLMETLNASEVEAVLAHELGHFRKKHIRKRLTVSFLTALLGLAILGWLKVQPWFYTALGGAIPSDYMALMLFVLVSPVFTFILTPVATYLSRRHEFEADEYATQQSDALALVSALVKLYRDNASTLTPDPIHSGFYDSHPPALVRVRRLMELTES